MDQLRRIVLFRGKTQNEFMNMSLKTRKSFLSSTINKNVKNWSKKTAS